jgi:alpha-amylase
VHYNHALHLRIATGLLLLATGLLAACGGGGGDAVTTPPPPPPPALTVSVHYLRATPTYSGWGLHLWGNAIAASVATTWTTPRAFDRVENGAAVFDVPIIDDNQPFNFIVHNGDLKSPLLDHSIVPGTFGHTVWVVQDSVASQLGGVAMPYATEAAARTALAQLGNRSASLDLSTVTPVPRDSGLPADWAARANFIEIYVRGYQDSNGDGIGDLQGLISRLDYLRDQGFTGIWLMPVTKSADHDHGYAVEDYRAIEPDYGQLADFDALIAAAHARGIAVIMDYVMNHSASSNPLFIDATAGAGNPRRNWYVWSATHPAGWNTFSGDPWRNDGDGWYYGVFAQLMPDFNLTNPAVVAYHQDNLRFWLNRGVDGFRFDAVSELIEDSATVWQDAPENHALLAQMQAVINGYPRRYMVCEAPSAPAAYAASTSCGRAFAFQATGELYASARGTGVDAGLITFLQQPLADRMPLILGNHDSFAGDRVWTQLGGNQEQYKLLAVSYLLASATPFTYYGEEVGLANGGGLSGDAALRTPMSWNNTPVNAGFSTATPFRALSANFATQNVTAGLADPNSLLQGYRALLNLRKSWPVVGSGTLSLQSVAGDAVLRLVRQSATECAAIAVNYSAVSQAVTEATSCGPAVFTGVYGASGTVTANGAGSLTITVPARSAVVYHAAH